MMLENSMALPDFRKPAAYVCDLCPEGSDDEADMVIIDPPQVYYGHNCRTVCGHCWHKYICHQCKQRLADGPTIDHVCIQCEAAWYRANPDELVDAVDALRRCDNGLKVLEIVAMNSPALSLLLHYKGEIDEAITNHDSDANRRMAEMRKIEGEA